MKRVAFFVLGWPVCTYVAELAEALAAEGVQVDFFFDTSMMACIDFSEHTRKNNINYIHVQGFYSPPGTEKNFTEWIDNVIQDIEKYSNVPYDVMIGVEKIGVTIAYIIGKVTGSPYLYWSMELYDLNNVQWCEWAIAPELLLQLEAFAKNNALATIVQDLDRAERLDAITGCAGKKIYFPIVIGSQYVHQQKTKVLHQLYTIDKNKNILFQFGANRMKQESIMRMVESLPENWICVMHGRDIAGSCKDISHDKLCVFSNNLEESLIPFVIASATAGLVHYEAAYENDVLTVNSSEKMARYLAAGVPIVVHAVGKYPAYIARTQCGVSYDDAAQIGAAVAQIEAQQAQYRAAALEAGKGYIFENVSEKLVRFIKSI